MNPVFILIFTAIFFTFVVYMVVDIIRFTKKMEKMRKETDLMLREFEVQSRPQSKPLRPQPPEQNIEELKNILKGIL